MLCYPPGDTAGEDYQRREPIAHKEEGENTRRILNSGGGNQSSSPPPEVPGFPSFNIAMMCASHVYKRRKLPNSVALLSGDNGVGGTKGGSPASSSMIPKCSPYLVSRLAAQAEGSRDVEPPSNSVEGRHLCRKLPVTSARKLTSLGNGPDDCCSSSKPSMERASSSARVAGSGDSGECTSSGTLQTGPSSAQLVPGDVPGSPSSSLDFLGGDDPRFDMPCKVCGVKGSPLRMLICDLCDEAFHFSCCKARRLPEDEWYCRPCLRKKPKVLPETLSGQLFYIMSQKKKRRILREKLGPILSMLVDSDPYTSGVRIGKKFQAEVPEWTGPVPDGDDYLAKASSELDPREWGGSLNAGSCSPRQRSIGNWLQCREMVYNEADENDEGTICGKWRRAPLFEPQTEDWDCSCALLWDPIHADCAVPQELETSQVLKHLKYVELLRTRLVDKRGDLQ